MVKEIEYVFSAFDRDIMLSLMYFDDVKSSSVCLKYKVKKMTYNVNF